MGNVKIFLLFTFCVAFTWFSLKSDQLELLLVFTITLNDNRKTVDAALLTDKLITYCFPLRGRTVRTLVLPCSVVEISPVSGLIWNSFVSRMLGISLTRLYLRRAFGVSGSSWSVANTRVNGTARATQKTYVKVIETGYGDSHCLLKEILLNPHA